GRRPGETMMFTTLGRFLVRRRRLVLIASAILVAAFIALAGGAFSVLKGGGFEDPDSESARAAEVLRNELGRVEPSTVLIIDAGPALDDPATAEAIAEVDREMSTVDGVIEVMTWWELGQPDLLRSLDGEATLAFVTVDPDLADDESDDLVEQLRSDYSQVGDIEISFGGIAPVFAAVNQQIADDLVVAQMIALPITLILLLFIFRGLVAAGLPLLIGLCSIFGALGILFVVGSITDVSIYAVNLITALGLGLGIDFSLFMVSRFREELEAGFSVEDAVVRTVETSGRTIVFSGLTTMLSLSALIVFPLFFLRSFAYAGAATVALATAAAVLTLPAVLAVAGTRINKLAIRKAPAIADEGGRFARLARGVMKRPASITIAVVAVLVLVGTPFLRAEYSAPDHRVLPEGNWARESNEVLRSEFTTVEANAFDVVSPEALGADEVAEVAATLSMLDNVFRVDTPDGIFVNGVLLAEGYDDGGFASPTATRWNVVPLTEPVSNEGQALVREIRALEGMPELLVSGEAAELIDTKAAIRDRLPLAGAIIGITGLVILYVMLRSVLLPIKAMVLNLLSLTATFGSMVWIFQDGNGADLLGFTATGAIDTTMPILMFCVAFGLSIDYEVFLLSRIREEHQNGADTETATALGIQRTGGIVTASALLLAITFGSFATGGISFIKLFGIGLAVAVLADAFFVRVTLLPAVMKLLGERAWWTPGRGARLNERVAD
ncbi:MAG: MMPL family transporter, partial [Actinomycetota bacterium]